MTEEELRREIFRAAGRPRDRADDRVQPPFVEMVLERHPDEPFDYGERRRRQLKVALGEPDKVYRPALGAPFVEISRHPLAGAEVCEGVDAGQEGWAYVTNGMSDFPQIAAAGTRIRTELAAITRHENTLAVDLLHSLAVAPFAEGTALETPAALRLAEPRYLGFDHVLLSEPPPSRLPSGIALGDETVTLVLVTALSAAEYERAGREPLAAWIDELLERESATFLDGRFGLEAAPTEESTATPAVGGLGCLEEATDSPCPQCGGELHEADPMESTEAMLVCGQCGWTAMASAAEHTRPYLWAAERFREVFGAERVEIDALPDGGAVVLRLSLAEQPPIIVELRSAELDVNRSSDPAAAVEEKLRQVEEFLGTAARRSG